MNDRSQDNGDDKPTYPGASEAGFSAAVADAVRRAEENGTLVPPDPDGEPIVLKVIDWEVDVHGPLGEYRVVLKPRD
jgi:hypothetical protein